MLLDKVENIKSIIKEEDYKSVLNKYQDRGTRYAYDVLFTDKYVTGQFVQLACLRHLNDLKRIKNDDKFIFDYDINFANAIIYFAELSPNPSDMNKLIELQEWQAFILASLIGWRNTETKGNRFHQAVISMARQNGKTWISSIITSFYYFIVSKDKYNQQILIASNNTDQAKILWRDISPQISRLIDVGQPFHDYGKKLGTMVKKTELSDDHQNIIQIKSAESGRLDGFHAILGIYDEAGDLKENNNAVLGKITSGQTKLPNALFIQISTAYPDVHTSFKTMQDAMRKKMQDTDSHESESIFAIVYEQDNEQEIMQPELWEKSNPRFLKDSKLTRSLVQGAIAERENMEAQGKLSEFATKIMNIWSKKFANGLFPLSDIQKNTVDDPPTIDNLKVYIGFDASMTNDNTGLIFLFPVDKKFYAHSFSFIPWKQAKSIEAKEKQDNIKYRDVEKAGFCKITDDSLGFIDSEEVYQFVTDYVAKHKLDVQAILYDAALSNDFTSLIETNHEDWNIAPVRQTSYNLNNATKALQEDFGRHEIMIDNDPIMHASLENSIMHVDGGGFIKVDRINSNTDHIDTVDALINAYSTGRFYWKDYDDPNSEKPYADTLSKEDRMKMINSMTLF
ncbi:terminase TerL endonuclease subunit [Pediococcus inopinatus]|uniref:terminase TerL endonuclease subunit n=1 Tax=Pediococcus inopinatus TaxID=114090 RepID=UPI002A6B8C56|nr:terminase TerL endonuclease subunit [Pediococcus inopinatus]WPP08528.1 terminase TerL endonuclease subunit [Pediococcus inopinatus]